jgi:hypothetical protein
MAPNRMYRNALCRRQTAGSRWRWIDRLDGSCGFRSEQEHGLSSIAYAQGDGYFTAVVLNSDGLNAAPLAIATPNIDLDHDFARRHRGATPGPHVALSVTDAASGMTREVLERATDPFLTTKPDGKGTGLGLSTVFSIVKDNGGCPVIESAPGKGTSVTAYFPTVDASLESEAPSKPASAATADCARPAGPPATCRGAGGGHSLIQHGR